MEGLKVLLVDDEEEFVVTLAERLRLRGIEALVAMDGDEALVKVRDEAPQVVVLDVMMPGTSGMDVLQHLRRRHPEVRVILLTGRGSTKEGIEGMRLGAFDFLMKPVKIEELTQKLEEAAKPGARPSAESEGPDRDAT
jgi:DNA-binding response OmpR family regulator